jgi:hypothetical protein
MRSARSAALSRSSAIGPIFHVKDGLRRLRYRVRRSAAGENDPPPSLSIPSLPQPIAFVADSILSAVEAVRDALVREDEAGGRKSRDLAPIAEYIRLATSPHENSDAFASAAYRAFKSFALRCGAREALISELALEQARRTFADALKARRDGGQKGAPGRTTIRECAALAVALAGARPIKRFALAGRGARRARRFADDPNVFVACAIGLSACIAAGAPPERSDANSALVTADAAIDARFARIANALRAPNPVDALTDEFSAIVSFLESA